ncbi:MAG: ribonucleoside-triphosphate reductase [Candidatus Pacebacteria bacterium]|nr:ribonucleoside-triphosphate reductase [Candidatus Paceibacterota bacterium]
MKKTTKKAVKKIDFVKKVQKRDGSIVDFDLNKIINAVYKAMLASGEGSDKEAELVANKVYLDLIKISKRFKNFLPNIEGIQDSIEKELILNDYIKTAKAYILYREQRTKLRGQGIKVPEKVRKLAKESKDYFKNPLAEFVYYRSYSKWIDDEGRRETFIETVDRYMDFMKENLGKKLKSVEYKKIKEFILNQKAMPSMRLFWSSGKAARRCNASGYNCAFIAPSCFQDFGEILYLSANGCGVGFSAESHNVQKLPQIKIHNGKLKMRKTYVVKDSKEGWADAMVYGMKTWFNGEDVQFDFSQVRPAGAKLKTMGGRSSGPGPLKSLLDFSRELILKRHGKRLSNLDVHDIVTKIGEAIVSGGMRRTAMISLSDLDDNEMRLAKSGQFYLTHPHRSMANNSTAYNEKPTASDFIDEWVALTKSGTGERGIFNRSSLEKQLPERRRKIFKDHMEDFGVNPCGEINLRSKQFCNLSEVVARAEDTEKTLLEKAEIAALLGTYQATLTNFNYLSDGWKKNCEEERLIGVSITGHWDCPVVRDSKTLQKIKDKVIKTNQKYAKRFGVACATCATCVKPSGTVSQLVDCASGMHPRHSKYYIRRIRISATDGLFKMLKDQGIPYHPENGQKKDDANTYVFEFPVKAPNGKNSIFKNDLSAMDQLEHWQMVKENFTEHNPSVTISVSDNEWIKVANWVYNNWDIVGGLSFLPRNDFVYKLAPFEEIDKQTYERMMERFKHIDFAKIVTYEQEDNTEGAKELACVAGLCEV